MKKWLLSVCLLMAFVIPLTGCGGGGGGSSSAPTQSVSSIQTSLASGTSYTTAWSGGTTATAANQIIPAATITGLTNGGASKALVVTNNGSNQIVWVQKDGAGNVQYASLTPIRNAGETDLQFAQRLAASAVFSATIPNVTLANGPLTVTLN